VIFFFLLLFAMFLALIAQHFVGPVPVIGSRVLLMPIIMFYGALALPVPGMLALAFIGGFMWDALNVLMVDGNVEIAMGWKSIEQVLAKREPEDLESVLRRVHERLRELREAFSGNRAELTKARIQRAATERGKAFSDRLRGKK